MPLTLADERFHASRQVLTARTADATVLLDQHRGTYFTLNEVGSRVWELAGQGATAAEMIDRILEEYDALRAQVEHDVTSALGQLLRDELLAPGPAAELNLKVPSVIHCGLLIAWFKGLLRVRGFPRTLEWIRRRVVPIAAGTDAPMEKVKRTEYAVALAGALYPGRAKCLEQSLTLYYLLRRRGAAAVYCQGVQPYPFRAHAWVEYGGEVINDVAEHTRFFARLPEQLP